MADAVVTLRPGLPGDAARLAEFAARTFQEAFGAANAPADMALYLSRTYGVPQQTAELEDPAIVILLAEADGLLAGFAQLRGGPAPACVGGPRPIELQRFYVDGRWQGKGVAQALMGAVREEAGRRGAGVLWLGVWQRNHRAQAFYRKCGFADVGSQPFLLGSDRQTDRIMTRTLP